MSKLPAIFVRCIDGDAWESLIGRLDRWDYQQGYCYSKRAAQTARQNIEAVAIFAEEMLVGLATARIRRISFTPFRAAYVAAGPICSRAAGEQGFALCAEALKRHFSTPTQLLRVVPAAITAEEAAAQTATMAQLGYVRVPRPAYHTLNKRIDLSDTALRASLRSNWRGPSDEE